MADVIDWDKFEQEHRRKTGFVDPTGTVPPPAFSTREYPCLNYAGMQALEEPGWLVDGLLTKRSSNVFFGPSNAFKSFITTDLGLCVATGVDYHGHQVEQGGVLLVVSEGSIDVAKKRIPAWLQEHGGEAEDLDRLRMIREPVLLTEEGARSRSMRVPDVGRLVATIDGTFGDRPPALVIFDVGAPTLGGSDSDMEIATARIAASQELIERYGLTEITVTHCGWGDQSRARGSTHLWGSYDGRFLVEREPNTDFRTILSCDRLKDWASPAAMTFDLKPVFRNPDEKPWSLVPVHDAQAKPAGRRKRMSPKASQAMKVLGEVIGKHGELMTVKQDMQPVRVVTVDLFKESLSQAGVTCVTGEGNPRQEFKRIKETLDRYELIGIWGKYIWMTVT